ncbi:MAG: YybH family protein [Thermoanaerobaculia bacterium]
MRIVLLTLLVSLSLIVSACQPTEAPPEPATTDQTATADPAADREAVQRLREEWIAGAERDDATAVAALYTEDAVVTSPNDPPAEGREAIQALWTRDFPMGSDLVIRSSETAVGGDVAYDYGEYSQRITPPEGEPMDISGEYLVALERQADGSWKITKHVSIPRMPETTEEE